MAKTKAKKRVTKGANAKGISTKNINATFERLKGMVRSYRDSATEADKHADERDANKERIFKFVEDKNLFSIGATETQGPFSKNTLVVNVDGRPFYITKFNVAKSVNNDRLAGWYMTAGWDPKEIFTVTLSPLSNAAKSHDPVSMLRVMELVEKGLVELKDQTRISIPGRKKEKKI